MSNRFTCPHCSSTTDTGDQPADKAGACSAFGKTVALPVHETGAVSGACRRTVSRRFPREVMALVFSFLLISSIGILIALLLPAVEAAREAARRMQCTNQLKQIGLAMRQYELQYGCFPPAFVPDENGKPKHSWRVLILPFMEEKALYDEYRLDEPWDGPHNKALASRMPKSYRCPTESDPDYSHTSYAMIVGPHAISDGPTSHSMADIKDGASKTIIVAEAAGADIDWMEPRDLATEAMTFQLNAYSRDPQQSNKTDISSEHSGTINVLQCDGTVRFLSTSVKREVLEALMTIDGGETIKPSDL